MKTPPFITHDLLEQQTIAHGFFTRHGGVSKSVYTSLNCGLGSKDHIENINHNRRLAAMAIGGLNDHICGLYQIHSDICHIVNMASDNRPEGDALVTNTPGITLAILTADCVPILFADHHAGIIGAAHAGWRGAVKGVVVSTLKTMVQLGATLNNINAVIGPAIQQASYQVGHDLRDEVLAKSPQAENHFIVDQPNKWLFDLPSYVGDQLIAEGIKYHTLTEDTYSDDRFFSHRRTTHQGGPDTGRLVSMIRLKS